MNEITINFTKDKPLYKQLYSFIADEIIKGNLKTGEKLPSKRALALHLNISLNTVENAYFMLQSEGYIISKAKSGFYVEKADFSYENAEKTTSFNKKSSAKLLFSTSTADEKLFPYKTILRLYKKALLTPNLVLEKGEAFGDIEIREALKNFLYEFKGLKFDSEQLVIASGTEILLQNIMLMLRADLAVENPGFKPAYQTAKRLNIAAVPIGLNKNGLAISELYKSRAKLLFTTPNHQFPLGLSFSQKNRTDIVKWADEKNAYIIEDDYDSEFKHLSRPLPCLFAMSNRVIYISSFTKTLSPSLRFSYMVLPKRLVKLYKELFSQSPCSVSRLDQSMLSLLINDGSYARHIRRVSKSNAKKLALLLDNLSKIEAVSPEGYDFGLHLVLSIKNTDEKILKNCLTEQNIQANFVSDYYIGEYNEGTKLILGYAGLNDTDIAVSVKKLELCIDKVREK